jgi:hypothetical protein
MKMIVTTLCILLLIIGFAIGYQAYLEDTMKKYIAVVEEMDRSMDLGDYEAAKDEYAGLKKDWLKSEKILTISIEHNEIDSIMEQFAEIDSYFIKNIYEDYYQTSYKLKLYFRHLIEKNRLNLETIL